MGQAERKALVDGEEIARILGITPLTVFRMAQAGKIPCHRLGPKIVRFDVDEVLAATRDDRREAAAGH